MKPLVSIVICFRDWGLDRLRSSVLTHFENARLGGVSVEVLVSDYGSLDPHSVVDALAGTGARIVRTEVSGPWNRSASLNAGVRAATGEWVVTTDADIICTPQTLPALLAHGAEHDDALYLIQCRDLPEHFNAARIATMVDGDWATAIRDALPHAIIRPRWGMGGFAAFRPHLFAALNGYEARMQVWGGEDNDFALRARRAGYPVRWLSQAGVAILHIWHEPSRKVASETEEGRKAIDDNRRILREDPSLIRNLPKSINIVSSGPLVSIVVPTYRRGEMLREAIDSCRDQTFPDWELLVIENGHSDAAASVVRSYGDKRIQYHKIEQSGAAAARNHGVSQSSGRYIVIHDDDDVMVDTRLEDHLSALRPGDHGSYGGWIDFDDAIYNVVAMHPGKQFSFDTLLCSGKVLTHGGLMLKRNIYGHFKYSEVLSAGIDYGFILHLARCGLRLSHTGRYAILRRFHANNMTNVDAPAQKAAAIHMVELLRGELDDHTYAEMRLRGRSSPLLHCDNEVSALAQLARLAESCRQKLEDSMAKIFHGADVHDLVAQKTELDAMFFAMAKQRQIPDLDVLGATSAARTYGRLRYNAARLQLLSAET